MREGVEAVNEIGGGGGGGGGVLDGRFRSGADEGGCFVLVEEGDVGRRLRCVDVYVRLSIGLLPCHGQRVMGRRVRLCCCCH